MIKDVPENNITVYQLTFNQQARLTVLQLHTYLYVIATLSITYLCK